MSPQYKTVGGYPNPDPYYVSPEEEMAAEQERRDKEHEEMVELLADIREFLDGQQDADYEPGVSGPHPNKAMQFCTRIDELIGEYT